MQYILSRRSHPLLSQLARGKTLCAFDFDGTLAPIVERPEDAMIPPQTESLLARVASLYPCIVVSGRAWPDISRRMNGIPLARVYGSHGAETEQSQDRRPAPVERWKALLEPHLNHQPGVWIEDKGSSLAIHYRQSPEPLQTEQSILNAAATITGARVIGGKCVVNLVLESDPNKGTVLIAERDRLQCHCVLYAGDDDNDEDAFGIEGRIVGVRVGRSDKSRARYYLRNQSEINTLLSELIRFRTPLQQES